MPPRPEGRSFQVNALAALSARTACHPLGPISFAGQHTEGSPSVESAIGSGHRAVGEVLARL